MATLSLYFPHYIEIPTLIRVRSLSCSYMLIQSRRTVLLSNTPWLASWLQCYPKGRIMMIHPTTHYHLDNDMGKRTYVPPFPYNKWQKNNLLPLTNRNFGKGSTSINPWQRNRFYPSFWSLGISNHNPLMSSKHQRWQTMPLSIILHWRYATKNKELYQPSIYINEPMKDVWVHQHQSFTSFRQLLKHKS